MKKTVTLLLALLVAALALPALAAEPGTYSWRDYTIEVTSVETDGMFAPADMTDDQYCVTVRLVPQGDLAADGEQLVALYDEARLVDSRGESYAAGSWMGGVSNEHTFLFAVSKNVAADDLTLVFGAGSAEQMPPELVGNWTGVGAPENGGTPIDLDITIAEDGSGEYLFRQGRYEENLPFSLSWTDNTFSVDIPATADQGSVSGTWELSDEGTLMLNIAVAFTGGGSYAYTAECVKTEEPAAEIPEEFVGIWKGQGDFDIVLTAVIQGDGTGSYVFEQDGYREEGEFVFSIADNTFSLYNPNMGVMNGAEGTFTLADGVLTLNITSTLASGSTYSYSVSLSRAD